MPVVTARCTLGWAMILSIVSVAAAVLPQPVTLYVNCTAVVNGNGNRTRPYWGLTTARDAIRLRQPLNATVTVRVLPGDCVPRNAATGAVDFSQALLTLYPADSGTAAFPIKWQQDGALGSTRLLGGLTLPPPLWQPRLWPINATATGAYVEGSVQTVLVLNLTTAGWPATLSYGSLIATYCNQHAMEFFYGGQPMMLARYPNARNDTLSSFFPLASAANATAVTVTSTRMLRWANEREALLAGYPTYDWAYGVMRITDIVLAPGALINGSRITTDVSTPPPYGFAAGAKMFGLNLLSELDAPGEYYFDKLTNQLYFLPPVMPALVSGVVGTGMDDVGAGMAYVYAPNATTNSSGPRAINPSLEAAISLATVIINTASTTAVNPLKYITITGFALRYARQQAITLTYTSNVTLADLDISMNGRNCVQISKGVNTTVTGVRCLYSGCTGIDVTGGNTVTLVRGNVRVEGCEIAYYSRLSRTYQPGIAYSGVGQTITDNCIHHGPHNAILAGGNDHLVSNNYISDHTTEVGDSGAWYSGRSWINRGNKLINNTFFRIRNIAGFSSGALATTIGVYLDDQLSGVAVLNNTFIDSQYGVQLGGGRDNTITGNSFITTTPILYDNRGMNWQAGYCNASGPSYGTFIQQLLSVNYTYPPYSTAYPEIVSSLSFFPCVPVRNDMSNNRYCQSPVNAIMASGPLANVAKWNSTAVNNTRVDNCTRQHTPPRTCFWQLQHATPLPSPPVTVSPSPSVSPSRTSIPSLTSTQTHTRSGSLTGLPSPSPSASVSHSATTSESPLQTHTPTVSLTQSPDSTAGATTTSTLTPSPSATLSLQSGAGQVISSAGSRSLPPATGVAIGVSVALVGAISAVCGAVYFLRRRAQADAGGGKATSKRTSTGTRDNTWAGGASDDAGAIAVNPMFSAFTKKKQAFEAVAVELTASPSRHRPSMRMPIATGDDFSTVQAVPFGASVPRASTGYFRDSIGAARASMGTSYATRSSLVAATTEIGRIHRTSRVSGSVAGSAKGAPRASVAGRGLSVASTASLAGSGTAEVPRASLASTSGGSAATMVTVRMQRPSRFGPQAGAVARRSITASSAIGVRSARNSSVDLLNFARAASGITGSHPVLRASIARAFTPLAVGDQSSKQAGTHR